MNSNNNNVNQQQKQVLSEERALKKALKDIESMESEFIEEEPVDFERLKWDKVFNVAKKSKGVGLFHIFLTILLVAVIVYLFCKDSDAYKELQKKNRDEAVRKDKLLNKFKRLLPKKIHKKIDSFFFNADLVLAESILNYSLYLFIKSLTLDGIRQCRVRIEILNKLLNTKLLEYRKNKTVFAHVRRLLRVHIKSLDIEGELVLAV